MTRSSLNRKQPSGRRQEEDYRVTYIELQRIIHVMEQGEYDSKTTPALWYQARADRCRALWYTLQQLHPREISPATMASLEQRVTVECQRSDDIAAGLLLLNPQETKDRSNQQVTSGTSQPRRRNNNKQSQSAEDKSSLAEGEEKGGENLSSQEDADSSALPVTHRNDPPEGLISPEELQAQQREQMERAVQQMAQQMKQETDRIHDTIEAQNNALLDELEHITAENVRAVTNVTEDVAEHVQQTRSTSMGTWKLFFVLTGVFLFTLVTIVIAPKRQNVPCFLFCGGGGGRGTPTTTTDSRTTTTTTHRHSPARSKVVPQPPVQDPLPATIHRDGNRGRRRVPTAQPQNEKRQQQQTAETHTQQRQHPNGRRRQQQQQQQQQQDPKHSEDKDHQDTTCQIGIQGDCVVVDDS